MNTGVTISGLDDCLRWLDKLPENCLNATRIALMEASKEATKSIRPKVPKRWRRLVKYRVVKLTSGKLNACIGLFNGHQRNGHQSGKGVDDWFKAYWINYGTLEGRDPNHKFEKPIKHKNTAAASRRRNRTGIKANDFFEAAMAGYEDIFIEAFKQSLAKQEDVFYKR